MKKNFNLAVVALMSALCFVSCSESYGDEDRIAPVPTPTPRDTTTHQPTPTPTPTWRWNTIVDQTVNFDDQTEIVTSSNISQLTNSLGETKLDSATLRYQFGVVVSAPTRIVTTSKDTTVYTGKGLQKSEYGDFVRTGSDSLRTVTTVVEGGFRTSYYTLGLTTNRTEGYSLHAGKWLAYKNVTETSVLSSLWHEEIKEIEQNDSIFNREVVHNVLTITVKSDRQSWTITREKVVVVDHFLKVREEEKKEEKVTADVWVDGLGRLVSLTRGIREDSRNPCDFALFEGSKGYTIIIDTYSTEGKYLSTGTEFHSFDECPKSNDYDGVAYIKGHFYPGAITYDYSSKGTHDWVVTCYINGNVEQQGIKGQDAVARGIKNFKENNSAYPWPYLTNMSTSKEVNGKKVITVNGKTSEGRAVKQHIVADSLLKN
jgi:hypothetical protein